MALDGPGSHGDGLPGLGACDGRMGGELGEPYSVTPSGSVILSLAPLLN
jgi:hypothetical protein